MASKIHRKYKMIFSHKFSYRNLSLNYKNSNHNSNRSKIKNSSSSNLWKMGFKIYLSLNWNKIWIIYHIKIKILCILFIQN